MKQLTAPFWIMASAAQAHSGHGLPGSVHWHAADTWIWIGVAALALGAWLYKRGD